MKGTITIVGNDIRITLDPENDMERMAFRELGDDISISRAHQSIVLRRRGMLVRTLGEDTDEAPAEEETATITEAVRAV